MSEAAALSAFTDDERETLSQLFDLAIPADSSPGGWKGGVADLLAQQLDGFMGWALGPLKAAAALAEAQAKARFDGAFLTLGDTQRQRVFDTLVHAGLARSANGLENSSREELATNPFGALLSIAFQGYYGGTAAPAGWDVAGFHAIPAGVTPVEPQPITGIAPDQVGQHYEVIVIGAGGGGGVAAAELAAAGRRVLVVERSRPHRNSELRGNHLQGKRLALYDVTAGPGAGHPRVVVRPDGSEHVVQGDGPGDEYGLVAMTMGGGTRLWQGMSWRFFPEDFRMASHYGAPADSTLVDWPIGYDELEPYYDRIEGELGVSGDGSGSLGERTPRRRPYPMPPLPDDAVRAHLDSAARRLGWVTTAIPFAINSVPRDGRPACVRCAQCVGHACPVDAKNGTHNTFLLRAVRSGNADVLTSSRATQIIHGGRGHATGVRIVTRSAVGDVSRVVHADRIVVAAGALETARLLLASGLGNDWVGRNHHSHGLATAVAAEAPSALKGYEGPGHSIATLDFVHNGDAWGGGVMFDYMNSYPLARALTGVRQSGHAYGAGHKSWMRQGSQALGVMAMVQEIPHASTEVSLHPSIRDVHGVPVLRTRGKAHRATVQAVDYMTARATEWVTASGGRSIRTTGVYNIAQGTEHSAGTVRMGADPRDAACDARGRLFGTSNVYVADASLHPTNGGVNPGLTVMANALRVARLVLEE